MSSDRQPWNEILSAIRATQAQELACDELGDESLAAYAERIATHAAPGDLFQDVHQHLRHCTACARLVDELVNALTLLTQEDVTAWPEPVTPFDLSFLPEAVGGKSVPQRVVDVCAAGAAWVEDQPQTLWISLAALLSAPSDFTYATATKGAAKSSNLDEGRPPLLQFVLGAEETIDFDVEVIAKQETDPQVCTVTVQAIMPSRWPQVGGIEVELHGSSYTSRGRTGEDGQAIFNSVSTRDLPQMFVHIKP
jgi:hypothetical protein